MVSKALFTSKTDEWYTPRCVLDLVNEFGTIGLDPCWAEWCIVDSVVKLGPEDDSLNVKWNKYGLVFVNPPYSAIRLWASTIRMQAISGAEIIALVPSRTDTKWFHNMADVAKCVAFWQGRLKFLGAENSAPFPSALFYFGENKERFRAVFSKRAIVYGQ